MAKSFQIRAAAQKYGRSKNVSKTKKRGGYRKNTKWQVYDDRNAILNELGFNSYKQYLASPLWQFIREKVLQQHGEICSVCQSQDRIQVHHMDYRKDTLIGTRLDGLIPICKTCHDAVEIAQDGSKNSLIKANHRIQRRRNGFAFSKHSPHNRAS